MSFGGGPMTNGSGLEFFPPPQYALHEVSNMQYGYQNVGYPSNGNFVQQNGPIPRQNRNGNNKYQNQFTNSSQSNNTQSQSQGNSQNQNSKKYGNQNNQNSGSENSNMKKNHEHGNHRYVCFRVLTTSSFE